MTTPKSPEKLLEEWNNFEDTDVLKDTGWLRSSMASLLCHMAERIQEEAMLRNDVWNPVVDVYYTLLTNEAKKITNE